MIIKNLVKTDYQIAGGYTFIADLKKHLLSDGAVIIIEEGEYLGILVPYDIASKNHLHAIDCLRIKSFVSINCSIEDVLAIMKREITNVLPVFDKDEIFGLIFKDDVLEYLYENLKETNFLLEKAKIKAEENDQLKSAFIANMSHEIRTPLNAILGFSNAIKRNNINTDLREKYLELISQSGKRLLTLISDIIDISRIDSKELSINKSVCNINTLIESICVQFRLIKTNEEILINAYKSADEPDCLIVTDETRLMQIFTNLLGNAIKFTSKGEIEIGYNVKNNLVQCYVKDTGIGIAKENQKIIFDRFRQVNNDYTKTSTGTGLGLSIVKGLVDLLEGEIWIDSEINQGCTVHFTFPYKTLTNAILNDVKTDELNIVSDECENRTILIAEDEFINFMFLEDLLKANNFKVLHAENGKETVELVKKNSGIDLILMDIKMPLINGYEATSEIRKTNTDIPIIALTAHAMLEDKIKAMEAGCNSYISKPLDEKILLNTINDLVNSSRKNDNSQGKP